MIYKQFGSEDHPLISKAFLKKDIYTDDLYKIGIAASEKESDRIESIDPEKTEERSIVFPVAYGKCYEIHFAETERLVILQADADPRALAPGESLEAKELRRIEGEPQKADLGTFVYIPQGEGEYLVIYTGTRSAPLSIFEHPILAEADTEGPWYRPTAVGDFLGNADSFADYRWGSKQFYSHLYDPLCEKYPSYVRKEHIGKDQSDTYDMYCYIFEPEAYEQTAFLCAGVHANEEDAYFALAYFLGEVANASGSDPQLKFLREKVRFIVIPLVNVYGVNQVHRLDKPNWIIRYNSTETDLNRDFEDQTQRESQNVSAVLKKYAADISFGIDFHTTPNDNGYDLFINFNLGLKNTALNFQTANHIYHRLIEDGRIAKKRPFLIPSGASYGSLGAVDGKYGSSRTIQAHLWNEFGIPPITVEYMSFTSGKSPAKGSAEGLSMAVEIIGNFVIQNALLFANK